MTNLQKRLIPVLITGSFIFSMALVVLILTLFITGLNT